jgi:hypothetical protein
MSDLPAEDLGYQAVVAEFFLGLRGSGLLLSPLDQELVAEWERRGLPVPVVCRGIRHGLTVLAAERRTRARSLRALRFAVEDEWRAYQSGRVGDAPAPTLTEDETAARRLDEARELLAVGAARAGSLGPAYRAAHRALALAGDGVGPGTPAERAEAALASADATLLAGWLASLPRPERAALGARLRLLAGARRPGESPRAHRRSLRAHLLDLGRQAGLTWVGGSV